MPFPNLGGYEKIIVRCQSTTLPLGSSSKAMLSSGVTHAMSIVFFHPNSLGPSWG